MTGPAAEPTERPQPKDLPAFGAVVLWLLCAVLGLHWSGVSTVQGRSPLPPATAGLSGSAGGAGELLVPRDPFRAILGKTVADPRTAKPWDDGPSPVSLGPVARGAGHRGPARVAGVHDGHPPSAPARAFDARAPPHRAA